MLWHKCVWVVFFKSSTDIITKTTAEAANVQSLPLSPDSCHCSIYISSYLKGT